MKSRISFDDLIQIEAKALAITILNRELTKHDLPLPKDSALEIHITQLLLTNPQILETAKARVLASQDAYSESLRAIGLPVPSQPAELDLDLILDLG